MSDLEVALEACTCKLAVGEVTLDECLLLYPEHAAELRPLLIAVLRLQGTRVVRASPALRSSTHAALSSYVRAHPHGVSRPASRRGWRTTPFLAIPAYRFGFALASVLLLFLLFGAAFAQAALPGDSLYSWKLASEQAWKTLSPDPLGTDLAIAERRAGEWAQVHDRLPAAAIVRQEYVQSLENLSKYRAPATRVIIRASLMRQESRLSQAGINVPALDQLLNDLQPVQPLQSAPRTPMPTPKTPTVLPTPSPSIPAPIELATQVPTLQPVIPTMLPVPGPTPLAPPMVIPTVAPTFLPALPTKLPMELDPPAQPPPLPPILLPSVP